MSSKGSDIRSSFSTFTDNVGRRCSTTPGRHRFIAPDPLGFVGGDTNFYVYVRNNPVRYGDPLGMQLVWNFSPVPRGIKPEQAGQPVGILPPGHEWPGNPDGVLNPGGPGATK